ncbi:hypothetical protein [Amycolatopsis magusensis]|uniref:hypothetical protein n=1 Tax=Amycolatopsis magusensis TaxID=882444 RepID=UPI0037AE9082
MSAGLVALVLTAVLLPLALDELRDWSPRLATKMVRWAARRLGHQLAQARYEEEWAANIQAVPGKLSALLAALGYVLAIPRMRWNLKRGPNAALFQETPLTEPIRVVFRRGYETLPWAARQVFRCLGAVPSRTAFTVADAARLVEQFAAIRSCHTETLLKVLVKSAFVQATSEAGVYDLHDLTAAFARELLCNEEPSSPPGGLGC